MPRFCTVRNLTSDNGENRSEQFVLSLLFPHPQCMGAAVEMVVRESSVEEGSTRRNP